MEKLKPKFKTVTAHPLYKGAETVLSIWLTLAHAGDAHVLSSKDFHIGYTFNVASPVVYIGARLSAALFSRQWVPWMVDIIFMVLYTVNYTAVFLYHMSEAKGFEGLHNAFFVEQRTPLRAGMIAAKTFVAFILVVLLILDIVSSVMRRDKPLPKEPKPPKPPKPPKETKPPKTEPEKKK